VFAWALSACVAVSKAPTTGIARPSDAEIARQVGDLLERTYPAEGPGAVMLVARGDQMLFRGARGEADIETHVMLQPDAVFRIGSVTKQFTAAALLTLVDAGRVHLDDPLSDYLPDFPEGGRITIRQLLNHTSGVRSYFNLPHYITDTIQRDFTTDQLVALFEREPLDFEPGARFAYSNSGYALAGAVIEAASGMSWDAYLRQTLFEPLGMTHTGYGHDPAFAARQVTGYSRVDNEITSMRPMSMTQAYAAGALVSNADDLLIWNRALHEGRVLSEETYLQMITPAGAAAVEEAQYGFGLLDDRVRGERMLWHGGHIFGFRAWLGYLPGPDISVVILENSDAFESIEIAHVGRRLAAIAMGRPYPQMTPVAMEASTLAAAEGVYRFDGGVTRTLRIVDGRLTAQRDMGRRQILTPIGEDDFLYPDGLNRLQLERDAAGAVNGVRFFANGDGDGVVGVRAGAPPPEAGSLELPRAVLERLVGAYANNEVALTVFLDGDALKAQIEGQPPATLRATSPTLFEVEGENASVEFSGSEGMVPALAIRQHGRETVLNRVP
jgi:CubicO group peptidase (beta-lactamase class C family)